MQELAESELGALNLEILVAEAEESRQDERHLSPTELLGLFGEIEDLHQSTPWRRGIGR